MENILGTKLADRYLIEELVGVGGMCNVYRAFDAEALRTVAVKMLRDEYAADEEYLRRFRNESRAINALSHPNIVKIYDVVLDVPNPYLVMEYVSGITLKEYIEQKKPIPGKETLFQGYLATMMIPGQVTLIPMFLMINALGWTNTYRALILPMVGAFGIFLMRQFMEGLPNELLEAAEIDGCGEVRRFVTIVLPLVQPALITLTIFTFNGAWNNFLWPLIINTRSSMNVLTITMATLSSNQTTNYGMVMAGATLTFVFPFLLYVFLQKQFVEGVAMGGVKG